MNGRVASEIVLVHGLWVGSWALASLSRHLQALKIPVRRINYRTTRGNLTDHAARLHEFALSSDALTQHFVGHSLGGLVILKMLSNFDDLPPGRLVFLGSPLRGSIVARNSRKIPGAQSLFGRIEHAFQEGFPVIPGGREAGMIAGSKPLGLGRLVGGTGGPGDGTVAVAETFAEGLTEHCVLPVTHTGMLYSAEVAKKTADFLETGSFGGAGA